MKAQKKWTTLVIAVAVMLAGISLNSCDNEVQPSSSKQGIKTDVSSLVDQMYAVSDGTEDDAILKVYESLNAEEFELFQTLRLERMSADAAKEIMTTNGRISAEQEAEIAAQKEETKNFFAAMDQHAVKTYGVHVNKLSMEQLGEVAGAASVSFYGVASSKDGSAKVQACTRFTTNVAGATETSNASVGYHYRGRADNDVNALICDYVFHFKGNYKRVRGERAIDRLLIRSFSSIARRIEWVGGYPNQTAETRLLFGANRYIALYGAAGLNNAHLRVSNQ